MRLAEQIPLIMPTKLEGSVAETVGMTVAAAGFPSPVGALAQIDRQSGPPLLAEVIGFRGHHTLLYPFDDLTGVRHGNRVRLVRTLRWLRVGEGLLGRVIDAHGRAVDGKPQPVLSDRVLFRRDPPPPCDRPRIDEPLPTGVRAIDALLTCGKGQRLGIFAAAGVGKSVLMGMMSRYTAADVIVIGLIGERGREVNDFIERDLGEEGMKKSVVVVATSNEPAMQRVQAAMTATAVAEYFRDQGKDVLLLVDSLTRFALAQREIGLAAGEPPTTRGYPPSVFAMLPRLVERAGRSPRGSITAFYTVLVEGDDPNEPVADNVRSLLDGHIWLSRRLASRGHFPAIDILDSLSRLMPDIVPKEHNQAAMNIRELTSIYRENEDVISLGAYRKGSNPAVDLAIRMRDPINAFLKQDVSDRAEFDETIRRLIELRDQITQPPSQQQNPKPQDQRR
ncbi:MAG: FliI/YscN family ATPase [Planctomycetota bacterium]|nr:MAG: FliI/YscN family ATPase [Planctomycetota bacterium]